MTKLDIIEKIPVGKPTAQCSHMHVVHKKSSWPNADVRITIDPQDLNKALLREYHPMTTLEDVITRTDGSKFFTVLAAYKGYFQIELDEESSYLTTFSTPFGRYRYKRLPMGISSAPELYQRAMNDMFSDIVGLKSSWMIFWSMAHQSKYTTNAWERCWNVAERKTWDWMARRLHFVPILWSTSDTSWLTVG